MPPRLLHIAPRLPPMVDGIGDYAINLGRQLRERTGWENHYLSGDPLWHGEPDCEGMPLHPISARTPDALLRVVNDLRPQAVLLHYVGYGYQPRGIPFWLQSTLRRWTRSGGKLGTFFHEIWASGPPWKSECYLHLPQRWLAVRFARQSWVRLTSTSRMKHLLQQASSRAVDVLPIPGNVPLAEAGHLPPRHPLPPWRIIVFGQPHTLERAALVHAPFLRALVARQAIDQVILVGGGRTGMEAVDAAWRAVVPPEKIDRRGFCTKTEIIRAFAEADFSISFYPARLACKSTAFMTALALGCPIVLADSADAAPLTPGWEFLVCDGSGRGVDEFVANAARGILQDAGHAGHSWYRQHADWPAIAGRYENILRPLLEPPRTSA